MDKSKSKLQMLPIIEPMEGLTKVIICTGKRITFLMFPSEYEKDVTDLILRINKKFVKKIRSLHKKNKENLGTCRRPTTVPPPEKRKS